MISKLIRVPPKTDIVGDNSIIGHEIERGRRGGRGKIVLKIFFISMT